MAKGIPAHTLIHTGFHTGVSAMVVPVPTGLTFRMDGVFGHLSWDRVTVNGRPVGYNIEISQGSGGDWRSILPYGDPDSLRSGKPATLSLRPEATVCLPKPGPSYRVRIRAYTYSSGRITSSPWSRAFAFEIRGRNPRIPEAVSHITAKAGELGLPERLALATAWTESGMRHFWSNGLLIVVSGDFGLMQLSSRYHRAVLGEDGWHDAIWDWRGNTDYGLTYLRACYDTAVSKGEGITGTKALPGLSEEECLCMAAYSCYNGGPGAISRYRTGKDPRDAFFRNHYLECPWLSTVEIPV